MKTFLLSFIFGLFLIVPSLPQSPVITSFAPASGPVGISVTIAGSNFSATPSLNKVFFGATSAQVTTASATQLVVTVPVGATFQPISVTNSLMLTGYSAKPFITTFGPTGGRPINFNSFGSVVNIDNSSGTISIAIGDLDGDGKSDLAVANSNSNTISVYRNISATGNIDAGSFANAVNFATDTDPITIIIGDINGDGKPELITANSTANGTVSILKNTSSPGIINTSSFAPKLDFVAGFGASSVALGDLDGDGKPDLAVANYGDLKVSVLHNVSSGGNLNNQSFEPRVSFFSGNSPTSVAIGDLDGDGKPELAVTNIINNTISVYKNLCTKGTITTASFSLQALFVAGVNPLVVAIADVDSDGKPELITANVSNNPSVSVLHNKSSMGVITPQSFEPHVDYATYNPSESRGNIIAIGDLNGDGKPDIAVNTKYSIFTLQNMTTSGTINSNSFTFSADYYMGTGTSFSALAIGDLDGDGKPELAGTSFLGSRITILNNLVGEDIIAPDSPHDFTASIAPFSKVILNWAANTEADVAAYKIYGHDIDNLIATVNAPITTFTDTGLISGTTYEYSITAVDTAGNESFKCEPVSVFLPFEPPVISSFTPASGPVGSTVTISGFNFSAIAASNKVFFGATRAQVTSATRNQLVVKVPSGATFQPINITDSLSLLTGYSTNPFKTTFGPAGGQPLTSSSFGPNVNVGTNSIPSSMAISDLDGDGKPDLVVSNQGNNKVSVYRNISSGGSITAGSFATKVDFVTGTGPLKVVIADINGDGKPDLIIPNSNNTVSIYKNTSSPGIINASSFAPRINFNTFAGANSVAYGDLDGDGKTDLVIGGGTGFSVLHNVSSGGNLDSTSFEHGVLFSSVSAINSVAVGDLDNDGKPDLAFTTAANTVAIYKNTSVRGFISSSSFASAVNFAVGPGPRDVKMADLDGDGKPELATINFGGGSGTSTSVLHNISTTGTITSGSFESEVEFTTAAGSSSLAIGDLNGDGKPEIATVANGNNSISVLLNTTTLGNINSNSFAPKFDFSLAAGAVPNALAIGDLNADGRPDLCAANVANNGILSNNLSALAVRTQPISVVDTLWNGPDTLMLIMNSNGAYATDEPVLTPSPGISVKSAKPTGNFKVNSALCPLPPTNIRMGDPSTLTFNSALILWDAIANQINPFLIRYRVTGASAWTMIQVADHQITLTGLTQGTSYEFQIANTNAVCPLDDSDWSELHTFITHRPGENFQNPIQIGNMAIGSSYTDTENNSPANHFGNDLGNPSDDIFYMFTLTQAAEIWAYHCGSGISDSYMYLFDANRNLIRFNDDNGPLCGGLLSSITRNLAPGTYYIVSEGFGNNTGDITTHISMQSILDGASLATAFPIISFNGNCFNYSDSRSNGIPFYSDNMGQPSPEIYYKFHLTKQTQLQISTCAAITINLPDTYLHLLNSQGIEIDHNDDNGPLCNSLKASLVENLPAGDYYIVVEGFGNGMGTIELQVFNFCTNSVSMNENTNTQNIQKDGAADANKLTGATDDITLYPNPANESVYLKIPQLEDITTITITDALGRIVSKIQANRTETEINTSGLANGIYFVVFTLGNETITRKLQVLR